MAALSGAEVGAAANGFGKETLKQASEEGSLVRTAVWLVRTKRKNCEVKIRQESAKMKLAGSAKKSCAVSLETLLLRGINSFPDDEQDNRVTRPESVLLA